MDTHATPVMLNHDITGPRAWTAADLSPAEVAASLPLG